ncbi:MAG: tRNA (adenosine(37)-N6)-threonylcarbamoyltransferase complex dimerization subunit type 1 TsaB [Flavobacterium sp.]|nr:tRNA (adenosine(37)-N6)-threonylcarbamoyltransferase complex dimerization subunit type 1 TsaB [Pedobacter sp.]
MKNPLILHIETATTMCSVALSIGNKLLAVKELNERNVHASQITLFIDEVMKTSRKKYTELNAVAVSKGPGSYTGLRIGVSTAKGLCFALDVPLISVNTLESMAKGVVELNHNLSANSLLCPMIDAKRMEVYTAVFDLELKQVEEVSAKILDDSSFDNYIFNHKMIFFGDGAIKTNLLYAQKSNYQFLKFENSAAHMIDLAFQKYENKDFENMAYFEPFYLKDFIAGPKKQD